MVRTASAAARQLPQSAATQAQEPLFGKRSEHGARDGENAEAQFRGQESPRAENRATGDEKPDQQVLQYQRHASPPPRASATRYVTNAAAYARAKRYAAMING